MASRTSSSRATSSAGSVVAFTGTSSSLFEERVLVAVPWAFQDLGRSVPTSGLLFQVRSSHVGQGRLRVASRYRVEPAAGDYHSTRPAFAWALLTGRRRWIQDSIRERFAWESGLTSARYTYKT